MIRSRPLDQRVARTQIGRYRLVEWRAPVGGRPCGLWIRCASGAVHSTGAPPLHRETRLLDLLPHLGEGSPCLREVAVEQAMSHKYPVLALSIDLAVDPLHKTSSLFWILKPSESAQRRARPAAEPHPQVREHEAT